MEYPPEILGQFKLDYLQHGKYELDVQVFHLARLAQFYVERYNASKQWTDCLKAHSLYNSISTRRPHLDGWKHKLYDLQQVYWQDDCILSFDQQQVLTSDLKYELESIRNLTRCDMSAVYELTKSFDGRNTTSDLSHDFFKSMKHISIKCSEKMASFSGQLISRCVGILNPSQPPCDFVAVALGSIARGEATPYSDLEFLFLVEDKSPETLQYFERLAITVYFQLGNLGETKLSYLAIKELHGWFDDQAKNGLKIDGLCDKAGNIPTGNGSSHQRNHFITTPHELAQRYLDTLNNPDKDIAIRGDLTAMLSYITSIYTHKTEDKDLLKELRDQIQQFTISPIRHDMNQEMLRTDVKKFNFQPSRELEDKGFTTDVKRELYRFPSILLLDISIITQTIADTSWESLEALSEKQELSAQVHIILELILAAAAYMRLSAYLYHDSQDDRMSVAEEISDSENKTSNFLSQRRWFVPSGLFIAMCSKMILLRRALVRCSNIDLKSLALDEEESQSYITTLYYTGRYRETLEVLEQVYGSSLRIDPLSVFPMLPSGQIERELKHIVPETLYRCHEYKAALTIYKHMTDDNISDERRRIADCYSRLGELDKALNVLMGIEDKSADVLFSLGDLFDQENKFPEAEQSYLQALEHYYLDISSEKHFDYYGDPIEPDEPTVIKRVNFLGIRSSEKRLSCILSTSPDVIRCVSSLGDVYNNQPDYSLAACYYKKTIHLISELYGEGAAVPAIAAALNNLGNNYRSMRMYIEAEPLLKQALAIFRQLSRHDNHFEIASTLFNLGVNSTELGHDDSAEDYFKSALDVFRSSSQYAGSSDTAETLVSLGFNYSITGKYSKAEDCYQQALDIYQNLSQGAASRDIAETLSWIEYNHRQAGDKNKADEIRTQYSAMNDRLLDRNSYGITE